MLISAFILNIMESSSNETETQEYELLFRHIFETQIHIQTQIRKTFILALANNDFL